MGEKIIGFTSQENPNFTFLLEEKEVLTIDNRGIKLNREAFPNWKPDDFVRAFLDILEHHTNVTFDIR